MESSSISTIISNSINDMFSNIFSSIDNTIYSVLDDFVFINCDIFSDSSFFKIIGTPYTEGLLLIANSLIFGYLLYYAFKLMFAQLGITETESIHSFVFKLLLCSICMNYSYFICEKIIYLNSLLSAAIMQLGESLFNTKISFSTLISKLDTIISTSNSVNIFSLDGILHSIISVGFLNLVVTYAIRYMLIKIFVFISPFCFLSLCNKNSSILFKSWFKSFLSLLLVQIFVLIILLIVFSLKFSQNNLFSKFLLIGSIIILIKANNYVREMLGGISTDTNINISNLKNQFQK